MYYSCFIILLVVSPLYALRYQPPEVLGTRTSTETWGTHKARVDNFNFLNRATYDQRYLYNLEFARDVSPPIIIYVSGEWEITTGQLGSGQLYEMAKENEGALYYLEHRFYGKSMPKSDYKTSNLKLLTSKQAEADLAGFIAMIKKDAQFTDSKVVLFGCSYSATLSTWMKHDNPDLITAVYATSGPMLAKADMNEFLERASQVMAAVSGQECIDILKNGVDQLQDLYDDTANGGPAKVRSLLGYCTPNPSVEPYDKMAIFENLAATFGNMAQTSLPTLQEECKKLVNTEGDTEMDKLTTYFRSNVEPCVHQDYSNAVRNYAETSTMYGSLRPFFYQQCTTFGWFVTTNNANQPFGDTVTTDFYYKLCKDAFNDTVDENSIEASISATNDQYGGQQPKVTNTVFVYGGLDPWQPMGLFGNFSSENSVFIIPSGGHCWDMFGANPNDGDDMADAKVATRAQIKAWLDEADDDTAN